MILEHIIKYLHNFQHVNIFNNYKYDENKKRWQFQGNGDESEDILGNDFNPVDGSGNPVTNIKDLCNMSASLRVNKVIDNEEFNNKEKLPSGGRGFASDIDAIDEQISSTGSTIVAGCKWYEGNGNIPSQCIQEGMEGLIEEDDDKVII